MENIKIYNTALSAKEVKRIFYNGKVKWYHYLLRWLKRSTKIIVGRIDNLTITATR